MAKRTIFENDGNKLTAHVNTYNEIYIAAGEDLHEPYKHGYICLDLEDAIEFRDELSKLINYLENES